MSFLTAFLARRNDRRDQVIDQWLDQRAALDLRHRWREACLRAHLGVPVSTPLGGTAMAGTPRVVHVQPSTYQAPGFLVIERPPGLTMADLDDAAADLADGLGVWSIRLRERGPHHVRVDLIDVDPLATVVDWLPRVSGGRVVLGVDEHGQVVSVPLAELTHMVMQGATGSGKSAACYSLLAQLAGRDDVDVVGIDPTGRLLGPWGAHPRGWRVCGTADAAARYELALAGLVAEMDRRIADLPERDDTLHITEDCPWLIVVLEEWAGVARLVGHTRAKPSAVHRHVARLLAEGRKVGIRVITLVQRAEADVVGAFERDQALTRLSFGCADANTLKMLHPDMSHEVAELHATSPKGVALLSSPEHRLTRIRAPWIGSYAAYFDTVQHRVRTRTADFDLPRAPEWPEAA
jgi:S-DNA-T family DNA segregation ATPase FtsK/SpoIIIE